MLRAHLLRGESSRGRGLGGRRRLGGVRGPAKEQHRCGNNERKEKEPAEGARHVCAVVEDRGIDSSSSI